MAKEENTTTTTTTTAPKNPDELKAMEEEETAVASSLENSAELQADLEAAATNGEDVTRSAEFSRRSILQVVLDENDKAEKRRALRSLSVEEEEPGDAEDEDEDEDIKAKKAAVCPTNDVELGVGAHSVESTEREILRKKGQGNLRDSTGPSFRTAALNCLSEFPETSNPDLAATGIVIPLPGAVRMTGHHVPAENNNSTSTNNVAASITYGETGPLVVAQLADENSNELLKEKEEENQALREELERISANTVVAERVDAIRASLRASLETSRRRSANHNHNHNNAIPESGDKTEDIRRYRKQKTGIVALVCLLLVVVAIAVTVPVVVLSRKDQEEVVASDTNSPTTTNSATDFSVLPVLEAIHRNGVVRCRAETIEVTAGEGFSIDLCRALAAAVLGDPSRVAFPKIPFRDQFRAISMGEVDVSTTLNTINLEREIYHQPSAKGYTFSDPYYYSGTTFAGLPEFVDCVDRGETFAGICRGLVICAIASTSNLQIVNEHFPGSSTRLVKSGPGLLESFVNGTCNVISGSFVEIYEQRVRDLGFTGDYAFSKRGSWSSDPLAMMTRESDPHWADFVNWILRSLIAAEYLEITQQSAGAFPQTRLFGDQYKDMYRRAIGAVGNYGELYERHYQSRVPRQGMNLLHGGKATGILHPELLGNLLIDESLHQGPLPGPVPNGTLEAVKRRGYLRCGLAEKRPGFAQYDLVSRSWFGLDVEHCKAVSAAVFAGRADNIEYVNYEGVWSKEFSELAEGLVDVLAGESVLMRSDVNEPMTHRGYTFSTPYFVEESGERRALLTRQSDPQWSNVVWAVSQTTLYAESQGITQQNASLMPVVELFGLDYRQMFRDVILSVGNYDEIYERSLAKHVPRGGWNQLNTGNDPQHFPYVFKE